MANTVLELFAGIGGLSAAWPEARVQAAVDINQRAAEIYRQNFTVSYYIREVTSSKEIAGRCAADTWWMSPPCQPYCRQGRHRDILDRRAAALLEVIRWIPLFRPPSLALENVVGFESSQSFARMRDTLQACDYDYRSTIVCPSRMGWPNRRPRFYLIASQQSLPAWRPLPQYDLEWTRCLASTTAEVAQPELWLSQTEQQQIESAIDRLSEDEPQSVTACFTSGYGKALLHSGSYLQVGSRYRRFTPREVARLLGFDDSFVLGSGSLRSQWKLLGQSLSLPAVRYVLSHLPGGPRPGLPGSRSAA